MDTGRFRAAAHLLYGGIFGGVLALVTYPVTVWKGVLLGVMLWLLMQVFWLPFLGWGPFGVAVTPIIAGATLLLHVIYGATMGWLIDRHAYRASHAVPSPSTDDLSSLHVPRGNRR